MRWILLLVVLLLIACNDPAVDCSKQEKGLLSGPDLCWVGEAKKTGNMDLCENIGFNSKRPVCFGHFAAKNNDYHLCKNKHTASILQGKFNLKPDIAARESPSMTRHCIYIQYNAEQGTGSAVPPDDYMEYGSYKTSS